MIKHFLTTLSLVIAFQAYASLPEGYTDCNQKMDMQTEKLLLKINQSPTALREIPLEELERMIKEERSTATPHPDISIENVFIEGPNGLLGLRIYKPKSDGPLPVFIFLHGGGWTIGTLNYSDYFCQEISEKSKCMVISVDYGQAPRYTFPQPLDDCFFAAEWIEKNIGHKGGDVHKIAIGGNSAGGNLAAAVTLKARDNQSPHFLCQILMCPALNYNFDTLSYFEFSDGYSLSRNDMKFFWNNYVAKNQERSNPLISPLQAESLKDLPPAFLVVANFDPLRDEALAYGLRLYREGVPTTIKRFNSIHGFCLSQGLEVSNEAITFISSSLLEIFSKEGG